MGQNPTLYIFPTTDDEGRYWAGRLSETEGKETTVLIRESVRSSVLMSLVRHWEELSGEKTHYWLGSLWDIPVVRRMLKHLRDQSQELVLGKLAEEAKCTSQFQGYAERDAEAIRCFRELLDPSEEIVSLEAWRELTGVCRNTLLEVGELPWPLQVINEHDPLPDSITELWAPQFYVSSKHQWPNWLEQVKNMTATAALSDSRGVNQRPDYGAAKLFSWNIAKQLVFPREDVPELPTIESEFRLENGQLRKSWQQKIDKHVFSASELETYSHCPYWYYCERVLGLRPLEEETWDVDSKEMGLLIHGILEEFYQRHLTEFLKSRGTIADKSGLFGDLDDIIEKAIKDLQEQRQKLSPLLVERHIQKIKRALHSLVERDLSDMASQKNPLYPHYLEWSFGANGNPPLIIEGPKGQEIRVRGKIDRIDVDPVSKTFLIIDYKTGSRRITGRDIERADSLQLPLYIEAVRQLLLPAHFPVGGVFFSVSDITKTTGMLRLDYISDYFDVSIRSSSLMSPEKWQLVMDNSLDNVREIVARIRDADFPVSDEPCAAYCPYKDMCRCGSE